MNRRADVLLAAFMGLAGLAWLALALIGLPPVVIRVLKTVHDPLTFPFTGRIWVAEIAASCFLTGSAAIYLFIKRTRAPEPTASRRPGVVK